MPAFIPSSPLPLSPRRSRSPPLTPLVPPPHIPRSLRSPRATLASPLLLLSANPAWLQTLSSAFSSLNLPTPLIEWGHPVLMAFLVLGMGLPGAAIGWQGRTNPDRKAALKQKQLHENVMLAFFLLAFLGGLGGTLSVAMQDFDIWETPHFKSSALVLAMLAFNSVLAYSGFTVGNDGTPKGRLQGRKLHAWFGVATMTTFLVHGVLGVLILLE